MLLPFQIALILAIKDLLINSPDIFEMMEKYRLIY
jgi:hypothetical protein